MHRRPKCEVILAWALTCLLVASAQATGDPFADGRPITILVYTKPGGAIDITARLVAGIGKKHTAVPIVVDNKAGAGGIVAMNHFLQKPSDGHTILGLTSSVISSATRFRKTGMLDELDFLAVMVKDYECLITNRERDSLVTFEDIVADARKKGGGQLWSGPGIGGTDHIFAMKTWKALGVEARWIPYKGGAKAMASLMGKHCAVYVGNPGDTRGRPVLRVAATASPGRYPEYPDAPTFRELGFDQLTGEILWRGFALKKGTPAAERRYLLDLLQKVGRDPEWREFIQQGQVQSVFITGDKLVDMVNEQIETDTAFMTAAGFRNIHPEKQGGTTGRTVSWFGFLVAMGSVTVLVYRVPKHRSRAGDILTAVALAFIGAMSIVMSRAYVLDRESTFSAATVPRIWAALLLGLSCCLVLSILLSGDRGPSAKPFPSRVLGLLVVTLLYVLMLPLLGYVITTLVYLLIVGPLMLYRRFKVLLPVACIWVGFVYAIFYRILHVPVPMWGSIFQ